MCARATAPSGDARVLAGLDAALWRFPVASTLETLLLSRTYLHAMTVKVSATGDGKASSHVTMNTHTAYYPLSLLSASTGRVCRPWQCAQDAMDALEIAMEQVPLVFAGPDGQFDSMKHAALSAAQMRLRPKVVYTLMSLRDLAARAAAIAMPVPSADADAVDDAGELDRGGEIHEILLCDSRSAMRRSHSAGSASW
eukprot:COSAG01_NODE_3078_length_6628_cov_30.180885_10_plen_197_part_00